MFREFLLAAVVSSALAVLVGCSGGESRELPDTVNVSGTIYLDGDPAEGVEVQFISKEPEFSGYAKTGADGKYTLVQGAVAGPNKVLISKVEGGAEFQMSPDEGMDEGQLDAMSGVGGPQDRGGAGKNVARELIPPEYSDIAKSKLTIDVPPDGTDSADFRVTTK